MKARSASIDTLRFFAAGMVCFAHALPVAKIHIFIPEFILGRIGVVIFFMISGYLIPVSLNEKNGGLKGFWIARFFRLYPMYWFSICLAIVFLNVRNPVDIALNATMFQSFFGVKDAIGVYWTLVIEMLFYIYCSAMFYFKVLSSRKHVLGSFYLMLLVSFIFSAARLLIGKNIPVAIPLLFSVMFMGYALKLKEREIISLKDISFMVMCFIITFPLISFMAYDGGQYGEFYIYIISYFIGIAIFMTFFKSNIKNKFTARLGEISYSMYLIHPIMLAITFRMGFFDGVNDATLIIIYLSLIYIFSEIFFRIIESPSISLGQKIKGIRTARTIKS